MNDYTTAFESHIQKSAGCWIWGGHKTRRGYGLFTFERRVKQAHRVAWELAHGQPVPDGLCVCHSCDNPSCVNPAHLFAGTMKDNMSDAARKGRMSKPRGDANPRTKLTDAQVAQMRELRAEGWSGYALRRAFGVSNTLTYRVINNQIRL